MMQYARKKAKMRMLSQILLFDFQVSYASVSPLLSDKSTYPYFFRTSAPDTAVNPARIKLMQTFGWNKAATIHQGRVVFNAVRSSLVFDIHELIIRWKIILSSKQESTISS